MRKRHSPEAIAQALRQAEAGGPTAELIRKLDVQENGPRNPIANVQSFHCISSVVSDGTYHPAYALAAMKQKTTDRVPAGVGRN